MAEFGISAHDTRGELIVKRFEFVRSGNFDVVELIDQLLRSRDGEPNGAEKDWAREQAKLAREQVKLKERLYELDVKRKEDGLSVEPGEHHHTHVDKIFSSTSPSFFSTSFLSPNSNANTGSGGTSADNIDIFGSVFCVSRMAHCLIFITITLFAIPAEFFGAK